MANTITELSNRALAMIGHEAITSPDEGTKAADLCKRLIPDLRDELIRNHPWKFASRRAMLPASATAPAFGAARAYPLPELWLRVLEVGDGTAVGWRREGNAILSDEPAPLPVRYLVSVRNPDEWDAIFTTVLAVRLAMDLAMGIAKSASMREAFAGELRRAIREARSIDAMEASAASFGADVFTTARLGGSGPGSFW